MNEENQKKCLCGVHIRFGLFCLRCDAKNFTTMFLESYKDDPQERLEWLAAMEKDALDTPEKMREQGRKDGKRKFVALANKIIWACRCLPYDVSREVLRKAKDSVRFRAECELKHRQERREGFEAQYAADLAKVAHRATETQRSQRLKAEEVAYSGFTRLID